jgi:hypothetical protein
MDKRSATAEHEPDNLAPPIALFRRAKYPSFFAQ